MSRKGILQVALGPPEMQVVRELAEREGLSQSAVVRRIVMKALSSEVIERKTSSHPFEKQLVQPMPEWRVADRVHILMHGRTFCRARELSGVPREWPPGHRWVSFQEPAVVLDDCPEDYRCTGCWKAWAVFMRAR